MPTHVQHNHEEVLFSVLWYLNENRRTKPHDDEVCRTLLDLQKVAYCHVIRAKALSIAMQYGLM